MTVDHRSMGKPYPRIKLVLSVICFGLACVLMAEAAARIRKTPGWPNAGYIEISRGFPELDALVADAQGNSGSTFYEEFLYAPSPFVSEHINFTGYYGARLAPDSVPLWEAEHVIWAFGSSTMQNTETTDDLTIANTWAKVFGAALGPTHVKNFGSGAQFSSYELIKFQKLLREVPRNELPTIAIFYDGYTDAVNGYQYGPGRLQTDLSLKLRSLVEGDHFATGAYALSRSLSRYSSYWERKYDHRVERRLFPLPQPNADAADLAAAVRIYTSNVAMIQETCQIYSIDCFFVLQPMIVTKQPLSDFEQQVLDRIEAHPRMGPQGIEFVRQFYARAADDLSDNECFVDASQVLDGRNQSDF